MSTWFKTTFVLTLVMAASAHAQQPVLQRGYDANVSGANLYETTLNASNIGVSSFGLLFELPVDDLVFAQPLYVPNLTIPNYGIANVVFVVTMSDTVFAFDADVGGAPLWSLNLATLFDTTAPLWANFALPPSTPTGNLGIMSTPVIDPSTDIMYVVGCTLENSTMAYRLHAIDITNGTEPYGPGMLITGTAIHVASTAQSVTVTNMGAAVLPVTIALSGSIPNKQFSQTNTCGTSLASATSCVIYVVFDPPTSGAKSASLSINSGAAAGTQTVTLDGTGVKP